MGNTAHTEQRDNMNTKKNPAALTPRQFEQHLARAFDRVRPQLMAGDEPVHKMQQAREARAAWNAFRVSRGMGKNAPLLSVDIAKTKKNPRPTYALAFPPHKTSGLANLCAYEDGCVETCVAFSGKGGMADVINARLARLAFAIENPDAFAWLLASEVVKVHTDAVNEWWQTFRNGDPAHHDRTPGAFIRLNAYSDVRWERVCRWLLDLCSAVGFYDYTKHTVRSRPAYDLPRNYRLTYSVSRRSTLEEIVAAASAGRNPAVVFSARAHSKNDTLPGTWCGLPVIDGDETDDRYSDPRAVVVGLRRKGTMAAGGDLVTAAEKIERRAAKTETPTAFELECRARQFSPFPGATK